MVRDGNARPITPSWASFADEPSNRALDASNYKGCEPLTMPAVRLLKGGQVVGSLPHLDNRVRVAMPEEMVVHQQSRRPTVAVAEGVDGHEVIMNLGGL